nr:DnaB-like helicase N-terminal domain-containing protein [uncultured Roseococcus sp.]
MDSPATLQDAPPADLEAEQILLGHLIDNRGTGLLALAYLGAHHFADPIHGLIYGTIEHFMAKTLPVSAATLRVHFERTGELNAAGGVGYLGLLYGRRVEKGRSAANCARAIHDCWIRRLLFEPKAPAGQGPSLGAYPSDRAGGGI